MGEDTIIDSIPLAEADLILVTELEGAHSVQYGKGRDVSSNRSNRSLIRMDSSKSQTQLEQDEVTKSQTQTFKAGFKRLNSTKIFNHPSKAVLSKVEEDQANTNVSVLQISTISDGFNSGIFLPKCFTHT
jgi:hypothetical protein